MAKSLTTEDVVLSLNSHAAAKGLEIREKYGPHIGWDELLRILQDRSCVRYPCDIAFDQGPLQAGECAHPVAKGAHPQDGFTLYVHPAFMAHREQVPFWALYQLVLLNYGPFASPDDAEIFGANALGLSKDEYYQALCQMADGLIQISSFPTKCSTTCA